MELSVCMAIDSVTPDYSTSVSDYEIEQAVLTIAYAMVNPYYVRWDVEYYGDSVKVSQPNRDRLPTPEPERMRKIFSKADLGKILVLATIVNVHSRILMIYLPNILSLSWLVHSLECPLDTMNLVCTSL
ncbi:hypothetical protein P692DRAFT_20762371 [Suillus brevipes Sb2]|nr:hypothetical protein P692DRAFT_20762371 [Suillus brevipes Sb2]